MADPAPQPDPSAAPALQAPWRLEYLERLDAKEKVTGPPTPSSGSFLRDYWLAPNARPDAGPDAGSHAAHIVDADARNHVLVRAPDGLILLNGFPYANGHLLVALGEPRPRLLDYDPAQRAALWRLVEIATDLMERTLEPQGINTGINQGRAAGAGVPQHLHVHLVPRWGGDVNFMAVVGQVRVIPSSLEAMARRYRAVWPTIKASYGM